MKSVKRVLDSKGRDVWVIDPDGSVFDAIRLMAEKDVGVLVVMEQERLVGVISERDYARKMILTGKSSPQTPVREIMTRDVSCVRPEQTVEECMRLMTDKRMRHLPVVEGERLEGIVSIGDLVKAIIAEQKSKIADLEQYIAKG